MNSLEIPKRYTDPTAFPGVGHDVTLLLESLPWALPGVYPTASCCRVPFARAGRPLGGAQSTQTQAWQLCSILLFQGNCRLTKDCALCCSLSWLPSPGKKSALPSVSTYVPRLQGLLARHSLECVYHRLVAAPGPKPHSVVNIHQGRKYCLSFLQAFSIPNFGSLGASLIQFAAVGEKHSLFPPWGRERTPMYFDGALQPALRFLVLFFISLRKKMGAGSCQTGSAVIY